jgi:WD40 repeat protein/serine/threonine protein kinase
MDRLVEWKVGDLILDLYEVKGVLGEGGMGKVYRVHHTGWNLDLAVKTPRPAILAKPGAKGNFLREAETWVNLGLHPHTVSCYYVRDIDGLPCVFTECVEGGSLHDWIQSGKLYEGGPERALERVLDFSIQFAWGLHYAHEQGLIHQDVKPANTLITPEGLVKVTDFGLAQARTLISGETGSNEYDPSKSVVVPGAGLLTRAYASPEQFAGRPLSRKTDIWSWAVSVLEMFTGEVTWLSGSLAEAALDDHLENPRRHDYLPAMPKRLANVLRDCFQNDPTARPEDANSLAEFLRLIYAGEISKHYARPQSTAAKAIADDLNNRAVSLLDLGDKEAALRLFDEALRIQSQHVEATFNRGLVIWRSGVIGDEVLLADLAEVKKTHPTDWKVEYLIGQIQLERDDLDAAWSAFERAAELTEVARPEIQRGFDCVKTQRPTTTHPLQSLRAHVTYPGITSVALSTNGKWALSGYEVIHSDLWNTETGERLRTFEKEFGSKTTAVAISPDSRHILTGNDGFLTLWDSSTGERIRTLAAHRGRIESVSFSGDGELFMSASMGDRFVKVWETNADSDPQTFIADSGALHLGGKFLVLGDGGILRTMQLTPRQAGHAWEAHGGKIVSIGISANGELAVTGSWDGSAKLWETGTGTCLGTLLGHEAAVTSVSLSADGNFALSLSNHIAKLWETNSRKCLRTFQDRKKYAGILNADGTRALLADYETAVLWSIGGHTYRCQFNLCRIQTSESSIQHESLAKAYFAEAAAAHSEDNFLGTARSLRKATSLPGFERDHRLIDLWQNLYLHLPRKKLKGAWVNITLTGHTAPVRSVTVATSSRFMVSVGAERTGGEVHDDNFIFWDISTGGCLRTFIGRDEEIFDPVALDTGGRFVLASGGGDLNQPAMRLWEIESGTCLTAFEGHSRAVTSVVFSADGKFALSGSWDNSTKLWDVGRGHCLREQTVSATEWTNGVTAVALSSDGRLAVYASAAYATIHLWEVKTGKKLLDFQSNARSATSICFSADDQFVLSGHCGDGELRFWKATTGECLRTLAPHSGVTSVGLSVDGKLAVSGGADRTVKLWDTDTGECLRTLQGHTKAVTSVALTSDNKYAISGSEDGTVKVWSLYWELEDRELVEWDEGARVYLAVFLRQQTPYAGTLPIDRDPTESEITLALTRAGDPIWAERDLKRLLYTLGCAGYGWLPPERVRAELVGMAPGEHEGGKQMLPNEGFHLVIRTQNGRTWTHPLPAQGICTIGRSEENSIVLADHDASRHHAHIIFKEGEWILTDGKYVEDGSSAPSTNGLTVNGETQKWCQLFEGDVIEIGSSTLTLRTS